MDFRALRPVRFGKASADVPAPHLVKSINRRLAAVAEASQVLRVLPRAGEALHAIMTGRYDLTDLIGVLLEKLGPAKHLRTATLSFNANNVQLLSGWIASGQVKRLSMLCSRFFYEHQPETFGQLRSVLSAGKGHRLAASRNHCKVVCFDLASGRKLVMEGSANLRTNSNQEQFCLVADAALHDWHAAWIDLQVRKHEPETKGSRGKDREARAAAEEALDQIDAGDCRAARRGRAKDPPARRRLR